MHLEVVEQEKDMLKIELKGESNTLTQLIATQAWQKGGEAAAVQEHPFMEEPKIVVMGSNPKKILEKSAVAIQDQCDEFKQEFTRALEK